jgi:polyhydroxyalkanoate synthesis regulator phasin
MFELLQKFMYAGVGAMAMTEEKAREIVTELEKKGHVTGEEGKKMVKELVEKGKHHSEELRKTISNEVKKALDSLHVVKKEDFETLCKEVHDLNVKIDMILAARKE